MQSEVKVIAFPTLTGTCNGCYFNYNIGCSTAACEAGRRKFKGRQDVIFLKVTDDTYKD